MHTLALLPLLVTTAVAQDLDRFAADLGSPEFEVREAAQSRLASSGRTAIPSLRRAAAAPDPEIARRARAALEQIEWPALRTIRAWTRMPLEVESVGRHAPGWRAFLVPGGSFRVVLIRRGDPRLRLVDSPELLAGLARLRPRTFEEYRLAEAMRRELGVFPDGC